MGVLRLEVNMVGFPLSPGYNGYAYCGNTKLAATSVDATETLGLIESDGAYATNATQVAWRDLGVDANRLDVSVSMDATGEALALVNGWVNIRQLEHFQISSGWTLMDSGGEGWVVPRGLVQSVSFNAAPDSLLKLDAKILSYWYSRTMDSSGDFNGGDLFGGTVGMGSLGIGDRIPYWQTQLLTNGWVSLQETLNWSLSFNMNIQPFFICGNTGVPIPPSFTPQAQLDSELTLDVVVRRGDPPPYQLLGTTINILTGSIILPNLRMKNRAVPLGERNKVQSWRITYGLWQSDPIFNLTGLPRPSGGISGF